MTLKVKVEEIYKKHMDDLANFAWFSEKDRWREFVFCLLNQCTIQEPEKVRPAVNLLSNLNLLNVEALSGSDQGTRDNAKVIDYILQQYDFSAEEAEKSVSLLTHVSKIIQQEYGGKLQRCLRQFGDILRKELIALLQNDIILGFGLRKAVTHWLQNSLSLPISLEHQAIKNFCHEQGASLNDLWLVADELDLNLAVLDDLVEMYQKTKEEAPEKENL